MPPLKGGLADYKLQQKYCRVNIFHKLQKLADLQYYLQKHYFYDSMLLLFHESYLRLLVLRFLSFPSSYLS